MVFVLQAFSLQEAKVLEYLADLDFYYRLSYGDDQLSSKLPCVAINDLLKFVEDDTSSTKVAAYFSHAELLLMILTAFGAKRDAIPLMADNIVHQKHRHFRASRLVPYAASIAAVKYECPSAKTGHRRKVQFLLNQRPLKMPWCKNRSVCSIGDIRRYFDNSTMRHCPHQICGKKFAAKSLRSFSQCKNCC